MPHYRVSESLPAELGCFDLVVIDEASQSDLTALPSLLRAKKVLIVGDILHSRVARSTSRILTKLDAQVGVLGPGTLVPDGRPAEMRKFGSFDEAFDWEPDVIYLLRVQFERQGEQFFPSAGEYHAVYGLTNTRLEKVRERGIWVMHPGPVNRGVELTDEVMNYERCLINDQVENGIATRMAILYWLKPETDLA